MQFEYKLNYFQSHWLHLCLKLCWIEIRATKFKDFAFSIMDIFHTDCQWKSMVCQTIRENIFVNRSAELVHFICNNSGGASTAWHGLQVRWSSLPPLLRIVTQVNSVPIGQWRRVVEAWIRSQMTLKNIKGELKKTNVMLGKDTHSLDIRLLDMSILSFCRG